MNRVDNMQFVELNEEEFREFENIHEYGSFYQTIEWGKLKEKNGWKYFLIGIKDNNKVIAAALVLKKRVLSKLSVLYSPRGYLIDYNDMELLRFFNNNIIKFAKNNNAIFIKIDPYIIYKERDINGNIVDGGKNNENIVANLKKLGYRHNGFNIEGNLQPRYAFALDLKNKDMNIIINNMEITTKQMIKKNERIGIKVRTIGIGELNKFTDIMKDTSIRRNFLDRPYIYYKNMLEILGDKVKILLSEINLDEYLLNLKTEKNNALNEMDLKRNRLDNKIKNEKKINNQIKELNIIVDSCNKKIERIQKIKDENGNILKLGALMFIFHNKEILSLFGGAYSNYREFMSAYTMNYEMIKYGVENGYHKYNFYGISEFKDKNNKMYGLYDFKKGFGGNVEEYIGEFNLIISKFWYFMYSVVYNKIYLKIKSSKH